MKNRSNVVRPFDLELNSRQDAKLVESIWKICPPGKGKEKEKGSQKCSQKSSISNSKNSSSTSTSSSKKEKSSSTQPIHRIKKIDLIQETNKLAHKLEADVFLADSESCQRKKVKQEVDHS